MMRKCISFEEPNGFRLSVTAQSKTNCTYEHRIPDFMLSYNREHDQVLKYDGFPIAHRRAIGKAPYLQKSD